MTLSRSFPGLIETMRVSGGTLPWLERHLARLMGACDRVGLLRPPARLFREARDHGLRPPADRVVRALWNGASLIWDDRDLPRDDALRVSQVAERHPGYPVKSAERGAFDAAMVQAQRAGADEPLLLTADGFVAETGRFALLWLDGDVLRAPDLSLDILPSIGRARVIELAEEAGWEVASRRYAPADLGGKTLFLVNAVRGVVPVTHLDGAPVPPHDGMGFLAERFWPSA